MSRKHFTQFVGRKKQDVLSEMGNRFTHYPGRLWAYHLKNDWLGRKSILVLFFENDVCLMWI